MSSIPTHAPGNRLLDELSPRHCRSITAACERVELNFGQILCEKDRLLTHVYFPLTAVISTVAEVSKHPALGIVQVGSEGMLGATLILGVKTACLRGIVHVPGMALRMEVRSFHAFLREVPALHLALGRYLYVLMEEFAQTAACTRFHEVETRLVRWLLLTHDRTRADHFHLTHQLLADMLGVQRSAVTIAAGVLQEKHLISYSRGEITIMNRAGLEAICCACYDVMETDNQRLIA